MVGLIREYPLSHSTAPCSHLTEPLLKTGLGHWWLGNCPESAGAWGAGQAEVVVLGDPGAEEGRAAVVLGPLFEVPPAAQDWASPGTPCRPWRSSPSSAAASINTKVCKSLSSVGAARAQGLGHRSWTLPWHCWDRANAKGSHEVVGQALPSL